MMDLNELVGAIMTEIINHSKPLHAGAHDCLRDDIKSLIYDNAQATQNRTCHYSEVLRIIEAATRGDIHKVQSYASFLADKIELDGYKSTADRIRKVAAGDAGAQIIPLDTGERS